MRPITRGVSRYRRLLVALVALAVAATAASAAPAAPRAHVATLSGLESNVLAEINAFRAQHGLSRLRLSTPLTTAAHAHSQQMARDGYFGHPSADGSAFGKRLQTYYPSASWRYWAVGENLLWSSPAVDGARALQLWVASPEHLRNLLDPQWREIGVSAVHIADAPGFYHGLDVTIVTTDFGIRR